MNGPIRLCRGEKVQIPRFARDDKPSAFAAMTGRRSPRVLAGLFLFLLLGCGGTDTPGESSGEADDGGQPNYRYEREYVFLSAENESRVVVPFAFRAVQRGNELQRESLGWLVRGPTWDRFLADTAVTSTAGGVWRIVPHDDLRLIAGGPAELEALRFERDERRLRLDLEEPTTNWVEPGETRFRLIDGKLSVGAETVGGTVLEMLQVERMLEDDWPVSSDFDLLFLTSGDSIQFVMAEALSDSASEPTFAWMRNAAGERMLGAALIRWQNMQPFEDARRDLPTRWSIRVPSEQMEGELEAVGFDALLGPERGGRVAIEVRFSVTGWIEMHEERRQVYGMVRHTQK
jgi:hypothetical protein